MEGQTASTENLGKKSFKDTVEYIYLKCLRDKDRL